MVLRSSAARGAAALFALVLSSCAGAPAAQSPKAAGAGTVASPAETVAAAQARVAAKPDDADAWFRLGLAWQGAGGGLEAADSARAAYDKAIELAPGRADALVNRGLALEELNRHAEAEASYRGATEAAPDDAVPWVNLGALLYFHYKKTYDAKTALVKALELDPKNADAHFNLGVLFADANLFGEARVEWEKVLQLAPDSPAGGLARENLERIQPLLSPPPAAP
jgi:tetratricopeptide (TPR) repeat protein